MRSAHVERKQHAGELIFISFPPYLSKELELDRNWAAFNVTVSHVTLL